MLVFEKALRLVHEKTPVLERIEHIPLAQARGKVLGSDIVSDSSFPSFEKSNMDGYAVRFSDVKSIPAVLRCTGESRAGEGFSSSLNEGEAVAIMTGAPLPFGADCVVMVEETRREGDRVHILSPCRKGQFISSEGECLRAGEVGLERGRYIRSYEVGILAALGIIQVPVVSPPRVSILATGDELVDVSQKPGAWQIRNSNAHALAAHVSRVGGVPRILERGKDELPALVESMIGGLEDDFFLLSGGVSMGKYDFVKEALAQLEVETYFTKVAIKPGKPTVFGRKGKTVVFGLPGNPVSTSVVFELFVKPALFLWMGRRDYMTPKIRALYRGKPLSSTGRRFFVPARLSFKENPWQVEKVTWRGSADIFGTGRANCLIEVPENSEQVKEGAEVVTVPMEDLFL